MSNVRFHGAGFIQISLSPEKRVHIWTPELPPLEGHNATIHNHRYHLYSKVILGRIEHSIYGVRPAGSPVNAPFEALESYAQYRPAERGGLEQYGDIVHAAKRDNYHMAAGSEYRFACSQFHSTRVSKFMTAVTLFRRTPPMLGYATILAPVGEVPTDSHAEGGAEWPSAGVCAEIARQVIDANMDVFWGALTLEEMHELLSALYAPEGTE